MRSLFIYNLRIWSTCARARGCRAVLQKRADCKWQRPQRAPALSHSRRSDCTVDNYTTAAGKRPPVRPKQRRRRSGWSASLAGLGRVLQLGVAERPSLPSRGGKLCPAPAPSAGPAGTGSEELRWHGFAAAPDRRFVTAARGQAAVAPPPGRLQVSERAPGA